MDWSRGVFGALLAVNHVDGYGNPFSSPAQIDSSTTLDLALRFQQERDAPGPLGGLSVVLSIGNVLDEKPPRFLNPFTGVLYDPTNSSSIGRFVSARLTKSW